MKMHYASLAIIFNGDGDILMSKRYEPNNKRSHGKWQFPGGGIENNETIVEAVIRETMEEANIEIKLLSQNPFVRIETLRAKKKEQITLYGFPATYVSGTINCVNDPESSEIRWVKPSEIQTLSSFAGTKELVLESINLWKRL